MTATSGPQEPRRTDEPLRAEEPRAGQEGNALAIAALVVGILAILGALFTGGVLGIILGIVAVILGVLGRKKVTSGRTTQHGGLALAGIITGVVAIVLGILFLAFIAALFSNDDFQQQLELQQQQLQQQQ